jgi:hypothetical protein
MAVPQVGYGGQGHWVWMVAANILNKVSRASDKGWPLSLGVVRASNYLLKKFSTLRNVTHGLRLGMYPWKDLSNGK